MERGTGDHLFHAPHRLTQPQGMTDPRGLGLASDLNPPVTVLDMTGRAATFPALSEASRAALVRLLVHGPASRADLARQLRLSAGQPDPDQSRSLEDSDLIVEAETTVPQRMGRPSQAMDVNVDAAHLIGIKLLAGEINLVRTDMRSTVLDPPHHPAADRAGRRPRSTRSPTPCTTEVAVDPSVATVGISLAGPVNPMSEVVAQSPFLGWENVPARPAGPGTDRAARPSSRTTSGRSPRPNTGSARPPGPPTSPWSPSASASGAESSSTTGWSTATSAPPGRSATYRSPRPDHCANADTAAASARTCRRRRWSPRRRPALQRPDLTYDELMALAETGGHGRLPGGPRRRLRTRHAGRRWSPRSPHPAR